MRKFPFALLLTALAAPHAAAAASVAPQPCALSAADRAWLDRSMRAWDYSSLHISGIGHVKKIQAIIFDKDCVVTSSTAMNGGSNRWSASRHHGNVTLPDGSVLPVGVISFAGSVGDGAFFVMSTPSVWRAGNVSGRGTTLENLMTAVLLHEATHVAHVPTYGAQIGRIAERNHLPEDFNDDSIQKQFKSNPEFAASVDRETRLLLDAAVAKDRRRTASLVRSARRLMKARYARWFVGKDAYLAAAEPIWLTFEGSGQWTGYKWMIDPKGGNLRPSSVWPGFATDKHWTQGEGFAAFMALERLAGTAWKRQAFHLGRKDVLQMLDEAVARYPAGKPA
jgi:hypothetical protein